MSNKLVIFAGPKATGFGEAKKNKKLFYGKVDRLSRFEIDDSQAFLNNPKDITSQKDGIPLTRVFSHPELFKQYPELKQMKIRVQDDPIDGNDDVAGTFDGTTKTLTLRKPPADLLSKDPKIMQRTLIHELQHVIQDKEGFAYMTPGTMFDYQMRPGEQEAYQVQDRMEMSPEEREKNPPTGDGGWNYTDDRSLTVPQTYYSSQKQIEDAVKAEVERRLKEKEPLPTGIDAVHGQINRSPDAAYPDAVYHRPTQLGVIYPEISSEASPSKPVKRGQRA